MITRLFINIATFVVIIIFVINVLIALVRVHHHRIYFGLLYNKHRKLMKKIPYYNTNYHLNNRSKIFFKTLKRFFTLEIFSNQKSKEYLNELLGMSLIHKTKDVQLINKTKVVVQWWAISDFFKGILFIYVILLAILSLIFGAI